MQYTVADCAILFRNCTDKNGTYMLYLAQVIDLTQDFARVVDRGIMGTFLIIRLVILCLDHKSGISVVPTVQKQDR